MEHLPALINALLADYYFISFQTGRGQNLDLLASRPMAENFGDLFAQMGCEFSAFQYTEDPENYLWLTFRDEQAKDQAENYFHQFNALARAAAMIIPPDIYEGGDSPNEEVAARYLSEIERFFSENGGEFVRIPSGLSEAASPEREYMVYSREAMVGLYPESRLFRKS